MKMNVRSKSALCAAALAGACAVVFLIYGLVNDYFDGVILLCQAAACVCFGLYALGKKFTAYLPLTAVVLMSYSTGLFFLNSYTVWADWWGHFNMYGSRGGVAPVVVQLLLQFAVVALGIVICFKPKGEENQ